MRFDFILILLRSHLKDRKKINLKMQIHSFSQYSPEIFTAIVSITGTNIEIKLLKILKLF